MTTSVDSTIHMVGINLRGKIKDDHLGIELLFLTRLIEK